MIVNLMAVDAPRAAAELMREQRAASLRDESDPAPRASQRGEQRGLERVLKQRGQIEPARAHQHHRIDKRAHAVFPAAVFDDFVYERRTLKQTGCERRGEKRYVGSWKRRAQTFERRQGHHRVADPVRASDYDATNMFWFRRHMTYGKRLTRIVVYPLNQFATCGVSGLSTFGRAGALASLHIMAKTVRVTFSIFW